MAKALKRKRANNRQGEAQPIPLFLMPGEEELVGWAETDDGPLLVVQVDVTEERFERLLDNLEPVTHVRISWSTPWFAIDLWGDDGIIGRFTGGRVGDEVDEFCKQQRAACRTSIAIGFQPLGDDCQWVTEQLPLTFRQVTPNELHPAPIVLGTGEFVSITISMLNGTTYAHRFETLADAKAQHSKNVGKDLPFAGQTSD